MQTLFLISLTLCGCAHVGGSTCMRVKEQPVGVRVPRISFSLSDLGASAVPRKVSSQTLKHYF